MVRVEGQEAEGPRKGQLSSDPTGDDGHLEHVSSMCPDTQSQREEVHGAGNEIQETGLPAKRPQAQSDHRHIHRHRKIHTVSDQLADLDV